MTRIAILVLLGSSLVAAGCTPVGCPDGFVLDPTGVCAQLDASRSEDSGTRDGATGDGGLDGATPETDGGPRDAGAPPDAGPLDAGCAAITYYADTDGDGHGSATASMSACSPPSGYVTSSDDCDDTCAACLPGGVEICDARFDENCSAGVDDGCECTNDATRPCGTSSVGTCRMGIETCVLGMWGACVGAVAPATEVCDGLDNDCEGAADQGFACSLGAVGVACSTVCGSLGVGACTASCALPTGAACAAPTETCNGTDDDCDGRADESLGLVGSAVTAMSGTNRSPHIVPLPSGFGVLFTSDAAGRNLYWRSLDASGAALASRIGIGPDVLPTPQYGFSARFDGANVVVVYTDGTDFRVFAFAPSAGMRIWGPFTLPRPSGRSDYFGARVVDATSSRATVYVEYVEAGTYSIRRYRLNTSGSTPTVISQQDVTTDLDATSTWDAMLAGSNELLAFRSTADDLQLVRCGATEGTSTCGAPDTVRTAAQEPNTLTLALAVRPGAGVGTSVNPVGLAWQRSGAGGTHFVQLTSVAPLSVGVPVTLPGSQGTAAFLGPNPQTVALVAAPSTSTYMTGGHFYVLALEDDPALSTLSNSLRAWELIGNGASTRTLSVTAEIGAARYDLSVTTSGGSVRVAEESSTGAIDTRQVGCR